MPAEQRPRNKHEAARQRIAAKRAAEAAAQAAARRRQRTVVGAVVAAVVVVVAVVVVIAVQTHRTSTSAAATVPANTTAGGNVVVVGSAGAPVTVDLYGDLQCPNCRVFEDAVGSTLAKLVAAGTGQAHYHGMAFLDTPGNDKYSTRALNATGAVVDAAAVEQHIRDLAYGDWVQQVTEQASKDGVTGTPTVFVQGAELADLSAAGLTAAVTSAQP